MSKEEHSIVDIDLPASDTPTATKQKKVGSGSGK